MQRPVVATGRASWGSRRVSAHARVILADNPSPLTYLGTNTWILADPGSPACVVVDPGPDSAPHLRAVQRACAEDGHEVAAVLLTHDHADHAEGAERFAAMTGAPVLSRRSGTLPDGPLDLGPGAPRLEAVPLPGHASDLVGFLMPSDASVMTGDMLFKQSSTLICWPDGSLAAYLESLERLRATVVERNVARLLTAIGRLSIIRSKPSTGSTVIASIAWSACAPPRRRAPGSTSTASSRPCTRTWTRASIRPRASTSKPSWNTSRSPASCRPERRRRDRVSSFDSLALRSG